MSETSVAIVCRNPELAERLRYCLEFVGLNSAIRDADELPSDQLVLTDDRAVGSAHPGAVQVLSSGCAVAVPGALPWPPTYADLAAALAERRTRLGRASMGEDPFPELVGTSETILEVKRLMAQVAQSDATVLITGESGTGKEVVARGLHRTSGRHRAAFVPVNCAAIPAELLESELFGHEKGAFTGALASKKGRFELAHNGTLFLDEIGDMPLQMQVKLLRAIQDKAVEPVGSARSVTCDVRIVAATNQNLETLIDQGRFREDLYYRLAVFPLTLPALREREDDLALITHHLLAGLRRDRDVAVTFTDDAWGELTRYPWPGNVRELTNFIERMAIQHPNGCVSAGELPLRLRGRGAQPVRGGTGDAAPEGRGGGMILPLNGIDLRTFLGDLERSLIEQALNDTDAVVARAADRLHIRRTTLVEKMRKYGIRRGEA